MADCLVAGLRCNHSAMIVPGSLIDRRLTPRSSRRAAVRWPSAEAPLKFWLGIVVVTDISLAGWLISSSDTAASYTVFFAVLGLILLSAGIVFLHRRIERRIDRIKEL